MKAMGVKREKICRTLSRILSRRLEDDRERAKRGESVIVRVSLDELLLWVPARDDCTRIDSHHSARSLAVPPEDRVRGMRRVFSRDALVRSLEQGKGDL